MKPDEPESQPPQPNPYEEKGRLIQHQDEGGYGPFEVYKLPPLPQPPAK